MCFAGQLKNCMLGRGTILLPCFICQLIFYDNIKCCKIRSFVDTSVSQKKFLISGEMSLTRMENLTKGHITDILFQNTSNLKKEILPCEYGLGLWLIFCRADIVTFQEQRQDVKIQLIFSILYIICFKIVISIVF